MKVPTGKIVRELFIKHEKEVIKNLHRSCFQIGNYSIKVIKK